MPFGFNTLTEEQRNEALVKAREVRSERARIKKDLKRGELDLTTVLGLSDSNVVGKIRVVTLLESLPKVGKVKARQIMDQIGISEVRRVRGLTPRQRKELEAHFAAE